MSVLSAFRIKPFDLEPVLKSWTDGPRFHGNPKVDLPLDMWLERIKRGCVERRVPEECWHKVAQHFMSDKARARFDELKAVIARVQGGKYRWTWKKYKIAMHNMSWNIDINKKETIQVKEKSSGQWWIARKRNAGRRNAKEEEIVSSSARTSSTAERHAPSRSKTINIAFSFQVPRLTRSLSADDSVSTTVEETVQAPTWLLNACQALDYLTSEHPKVMTTISAILITVGSIPAIPAISAGAGGALLASSAAHAVGAIAVGVGSMLKASTVAAHSRAPSSRSGHL